MKLSLSIKSYHPHCANSFDWRKGTRELRAIFEAGADRYLLEYETAVLIIHGAFSSRVTVRESHERSRAAFGSDRFQIGAGFMVGLPGQTSDD